MTMLESISAPQTGPLPPVLLLYDGECGLCHRFVRFLLDRDTTAVFYFAPLQGEIAARLLAGHGWNATSLTTVVLALDAGTPQQRLLVQSDAVAEALLLLGGPWRAVARLSSLLPRSIRDSFYRLVARERYKIFGKVGAAEGELDGVCPLPSEAHRDRFLPTRNV